MTRANQHDVLLAAIGFCIACPASALDVRDMNRAAARSNQDLPRMVAKDLRQERVEVLGMTLINSYTHLTLDSNQLRGMRLESTQRPYVLPSLCSDAATSRMLREGVQFRYIYRGRDGAIGGDLLLSQSDCSGIR